MNLARAIEIALHVIDSCDMDEVTEGMQIDLEDLEVAHTRLYEELHRRTA